MNVYCPHCRALYRVDPDRVPAGGVRARCAACSLVFPVQRRDGASGEPGARSASRLASLTAAAVAPAPASPAVHQEIDAPEAPPPTAPAVESDADGAFVTTEDVGDPLGGGAGTAAGDGGTAAERDPAPGIVAGPRHVFGPQDRDARARRIARALVSDIVEYNRERVERAFASGRLRTEFRGEILKSWQEYVELVGEETATETPHFRDALNDILARGERVF